MPNTRELARSAREVLSTPLGDRDIYRLDKLADLGAIDTLPYTIKVLLESCLRNFDDHVVTPDHLEALASYDATNVPAVEIPFTPGRVVLQDFTGVPAVVDLAAMRSAIVRMGGEASKVNPLSACDLVIDHSVQVDAFNSGMALQINSEKEFERNGERYEFLKWGQGAFDNFRVVPPATGIVHQVNLEYLAKVVWDKDGALYPDSLVGTDSHTTMINGLGVLGWGVGGIEAEAVMLGQPIYMLMPEVVGFRLHGALPAGTTATDLVLRVTEMLRAHGVVGKFVEFFGEGLTNMPVANRATLANMAPEYGATCGFFPVDERVNEYMWLTGRSQELIDTVESYSREQGLWREDSREITYTATLDLDLGSVEPALAGPKRPQDRIALSGMQSAWQEGLTTTFARSDAGDGGVATATETVRSVAVDYDGEQFELRDGAVVIAAITSCTNTSNPSVMVGAGLLARNAARRGLQRKPWVKTSLAPGSQVVTDYLEKAGLLDELESAGFYVVGYGCTTCIGNSGPLPDEIGQAIRDNDLTVSSVLSGNRNFEGRIHADIKANYLASPPLVVAYALAGTVDIDLTTDAIGQDPDGNDVFLHDIWPSEDEIQSVVSASLTREQFLDKYGNVFEGSEEWREIATSGGEIYDWSDDSTYIQEPAFFQNMPTEPPALESIRGARCLVKVGDSVTTDHISPAGAIGPDTPAGQYLLSRGVDRQMFNSYGSRRGNHDVMTRGTFANVRVRNELAEGTEGGWTTDFTDGEVKSIYDASLSYREAGVSLVVLSGKDYGMGSSRDWAAKGTFLLGVRAVIAKSYERIHRSNLVGMGVLPLTFQPGEDADSLGLDGTETFDIDVPDDLQPKQNVTVRATKTDGTVVEFDAVVRVDTPVEVDYYRNGGILHTVLRRMAAE
ncbi:MAG: aconitate hydratase AcnA [Acidobacteria bacterium]|nr:aconitate hydratase AcnA [Acidobacteriota bacterium]